MEVIRTLLSVDKVGWVDTRYYQLYTVPPCLFEGQGRVICPTVLGETADRGGRIDDFFSISSNGRRDDARKTVTNHACNCVRFQNYLSSLLFLHLLFTIMSLVLS